jgi:hypothetical protein
MKSIQLFSFFALVVLSTRAQDQLIKKDNTKILVKIEEVGTENLKFKNYSNLSGPSYTESKSLYSLIIYENGKYEVLTSSSKEITIEEGNSPIYGKKMSVRDSLIYFRYSNNISLNFLNFFNNELGLLYQGDFFKSNFNIVIPISVGIEKPVVTDGTYFSNTTYVSASRANISYQLNKKIVEVGFGINYYPSLATNANYYIGPVFKYARYDGTHRYTRYINNATTEINQNSILSRYSMSITNGVIIRTKSRLTANFFGSLGFKSDQTTNFIVDPITGSEINSLRNPLSLYFWCGFNVGFNF